MHRLGENPMYMACSLAFKRAGNSLGTHKTYNGNMVESAGRKIGKGGLIPQNSRVIHLLHYLKAKFLIVFP